MQSNNPEEITALALAVQLDNIYTDFTESIRNMGKKNGRKSRFAGSVVHWLAGSHVKTERDVLCEKFLNDVEKHLEVFDYALEGIPEEKVREACDRAVEVMTRPYSDESNSTTVLMKRAMIGHAKPYLHRCSAQALSGIRDRLEKAYRKSQRLPVEKEVLKEMEKLLQ